MNLYLRGSSSEFLKRGLATLQDLAERNKTTVMGAELARAIARAFAEPFFGVEPARAADGSVRPVRRQQKAADPEAALKLTDSAVTVYRDQKQKDLNLAYGDLITQRAACLQQIGNTATARSELRQLTEDLATRGANPPVLEEFNRLAQGLSGAETTSAVTTRTGRPAAKSKAARPARRSSAAGRSGGAARPRARAKTGRRR
jgi:hypothetical protein